MISTDRAGEESKGVICCGRKEQCNPDCVKTARNIQNVFFRGGWIDV